MSGFCAVGTLIPTAISVLPGRSPVVGTPEQSTAAKHTLSSVRDDIKAYSFLVGMTAWHLNLMTSSSTNQLRAKVNDQLLPGADAVSADLNTAAQAFSRLSGEVEKIHAAARTVMSAVEEDLAVIRAASQSLAAAASSLKVSPAAVVPATWNDWPSATPPPAPDEAASILASVLIDAHWAAKNQWVAAARQWQGALERINRHIASWRALISDREDAERTLASALIGTSLGKLINRHGRQVSRAEITTAVTGDSVHPRRMLDPHLRTLLSGTLNAEEVARLWKEAGFSDLSKEHIEGLPIATLFGLASLAGVPAWVQDAASRKALSHALSRPEDAHRIMGFSGGSLTLSQFTEQISAISVSLIDAEAKGRDLKPRTQIQFVGFGNHDDALTGGLVLGDLDTARNIGINVSGMNSDVTDLGGSFAGAINVLKSARRENPATDYAVAHWLGYRSPSAAPTESGVFAMKRAEAGGLRLSTFIDGVYESRRESVASPINNFTVLAHSYGSTTAVEAVKLTTHKIDHLVTYGSAGVQADTIVEQLNVHEIHATSAKGDGVAWMGIDGGARTDPRDISGVQVFSSEQVDGSHRVTAHNMYAKEGSRSLINWTKTGYLSDGTNTVEHIGKILAKESGS